MKKRIEVKSIAQFKPMRETMHFEEACKEANRCLLCEDAPCSKGCPAGTDPGKFIRQIKFENCLGAARTIRNNNIMGSVCACVCPTEKLCEKQCSIKALEDPINISGLQRFACEYGKKVGLECFEPSKKNKGKVAIIGAGPAGMSCAAELAKQNYDVTLFESEAKAGGVAQWQIPGFRLPQPALEYDIKNLLSLGVTLKHKTPIKSQEQIKKLLSQGYQAVFISAGLSEPFHLPLLNKYSNALDYHQFLCGVKSKKARFAVKGKNIAVIGGGSVAIDVATTATALGANKVYVLSLEGLGDLLADQDEMEVAHQLHVIFKPNTSVTKVVAKNKKIQRLVGKEVKWKVPGKFTPANAKPIDGTEFSLNVDFVIQAIGTKAGNDIAQLGVKTQGKGTIIAKKEGSTNVAGIFAGGDVINGGATVVQAVADGKTAAASMMRYLEKGEGK